LNCEVADVEMALSVGRVPSVGNTDVDVSATGFDKIGNDKAGGGTAFDAVAAAPKPKLKLLEVEVNDGNAGTESLTSVRDDVATVDGVDPVNVEVNRFVVAKLTTVDAIETVADTSVVDTVLLLSNNGKTVVVEILETSETELTGAAIDVNAVTPPNEKLEVDIAVDEVVIDEAAEVPNKFAFTSETVLVIVNVEVVTIVVTDFNLKSISPSVSSKRLSIRLTASSLSKRKAFSDTPDSPNSSRCC